MTPPRFEAQTVPHLGAHRGTQGPEAPDQCQEECGRQESDPRGVSTGLHGRRDFAEGAVLNVWGNPWVPGWACYHP